MLNIWYQETNNQTIQYLPKLFINNCLVPRVELGKSFCYLGRYFDFNMPDEDHKAEAYNTLTDILNEIDNLPLHPKNKIPLMQPICAFQNILAFHCIRHREHLGKRKTRWYHVHVCSEMTYLSISATLRNVQLPHNKFGLNIILPLTKFLQFETVSRNVLKSSPNGTIKKLWKDTSNYKIYNMTPTKTWH